jgi:glycosyltransferase involved in cell wall biosynthesis
MLISVCIITKNEESNIESCLKSVYDIADEIIILDSFSSDSTLEICRKYTSNIFFKTWENDFSGARNLCISKASGEWVLIIDADETLNPSKDFRFFLEKTKSKAFLVFRNEIYRDDFDGKLVNYPVGIVRLFKRQTKAKFKYNIHERLDDYFYENNIRIDILKEAFIDHHIYKVSKDSVILKQEKYLKFINENLIKNPKNFWLLFQKAKTNLTLKNSSSSKIDLEFLIKSESSNKKIKVASLILLALIYKQEGKIELATSFLKKHLRNNKHTLMYLYLGDFYYQQGQYFNALKYYLKLETNPNKFDFDSTMYLISFVHFKHKLFKITAVIYSIGYLNFVILILFFFKTINSAEINFLKTLIYLKKKNKEKAKYFLSKARKQDEMWKRLIELESQIK